MIRIGTQCCYVIQQTTYAQRQSEIGGTENECQLVTLHSLSLNIYFLKILRQNSALLQGVPDSENKEQPKQNQQHMHAAHTHTAHVAASTHLSIVIYYYIIRFYSSVSDLAHYSSK